MQAKLLFVELSGSLPLPPLEALHVAAGDLTYASVANLEAARVFLNEKNPPFAVVINKPDFAFLSEVKKNQPSTLVILVTEQAMNDYSSVLQGMEHKLVDHVIANLSASWCVHELRITLRKLILKDIFGIEKYLSPAAKIETLKITGSAERENNNKLVVQFVNQFGLSKQIGRLAHGISEELMMNAIYDAPVAGGRTHYEQMARTAQRDLQPDEYADLSYGYDGTYFAIGIRDPFGALQRDKLFEYMKKVIKRNQGVTLIDEKQGGAGLGLFKILYSSHGLVCNVKPKQMTEVLAVIDTKIPLRDFSKMARSVHYFEC